LKKESFNKVNELLAESLGGRSSRRDIIKKGAALGLSAPLLGVIASAHGRGALAQDATPEAKADGWSITVPADMPDLSGKTVKAILGASGNGSAYTAALCKAFQDATGATVELTEGPESATDRLTIVYLPGLTGGTPSHDVYMIDVIWPGIMAEFAADLSDVAAANGGEYFERIVNNNTVDGKLVGVPWFTDAGLMYYRKDLLEKYGYAAAPATWDELEEMAAKIQEGERAEGNAEFQGFVWQGAAYEGLTCNAIEWLISNGGGNLIETDGTVSVNNENAVAGFEQAKGWIGTISPDGVTGYKEEESRAVWQAGNAAFMRNWPYAFSLGQADDSPIKDMFDVSVVPAGSAEGSQPADCLGGWQIMVADGAADVDTAKAFAKFLTSAEVQKSQAVERSMLPTIASIYEDADGYAVTIFGQHTYRLNCYARDDQRWYRWDYVGYEPPK